MKKLYDLESIILLVIFISMSGVIQAQNFQLIDINKAKTSYPSYPTNNEYSAMNMFTELNGIFYFSADDGIHGYELWSTDGTTAGTKLVKDIYPGFNPSYPFDIITSGNKLYFIAVDTSNRPQIWTSDGTEAGTHALTDFISYPFPPELIYLTDVNGTVYFISNYQDSSYNLHNELWKTDGTREGTVLVADLYSSDFGYGSNATYLVNVNGKLFFRLDGNYTSLLYTSDGTAAGTTVVGDPYNLAYNGPTHLTSLNGLLYFSAYQNYYGSSSLWVTDGTTEGTHTVNNIYSVYVLDDYNFNNPGYNEPFTVRGNTLFFAGGTNASGYELCKYNTIDVNKSIEIVKDINPGYNSSSPSFITNVKGTIFFTANDGSGEPNLWKSDGSAAGTTLVKDINPTGVDNYYGLINVNGTLMFAGYTDSAGFELWRSDGTEAGTVMVKDIFPGFNNAYPGYFTFKDGKFLFSADNGSKGFELWKSDGTESGTVIIKDINETVSSSSNPYGFTTVGNNKTILAATTNKFGTEPWTTDGTQAGTTLLKDISPGNNNSNFYSPFVKLKNKVCFALQTDSGYVLEITNGTRAGTSTFYKVDPSSIFLSLTATNNLFYFVLFNYNTYQTELWRSDGTTAGTFAVRTDLSPYFINYTTAVGNLLFFTSYDTTHGNELWKTDGTSAGTTLVKDLNPGPADSYPSNLYNFNGKLYFTLSTGYGNFLWISDGTDAGTKLVKTIDIRSSFAQTKDKLFFEAYYNVARGAELYSTDGTAGGTQLVKDINQGPGSSDDYYFNMVSGDSLVYLVADDGVHGTELWRSNGTPQGTYLLKNITRETIVVT